MTVHTELSNVAVSSRSLADVARSLVDWVRYRHALSKDRRDVRRLADLDDKLLQDMGLERPDIAWALNGQSDVLPSHRLKGLRAHRSCERLAMLRRPRR